MKKMVISDGYYLKNFSLKLLYKKNYCPKCGEKYKLKWMTYKTFREHKVHINYYKHGSLYYYCSKCKFYITYSNQLEISKIQEENNSNILNNSNELIKKYKMKVKKINDSFVLEDYVDR